MSISTQDCIFCKIIRKEAESTILFEDDDLIVFKDINPKAPVHVLVVPKKHIDSLSTVQAEDTELLGKVLNRAAQVAKENGIDQSGYKVVTNVGEDGGQIVQHLHFHVVGGQAVKVSI